jgi:hypothetical protein
MVRWRRRHVPARVPLHQPNRGEDMHRYIGSKPLDVSSRGRTSRAHVRWLAPAAAMCMVLLGAAAVASNFQTFSTQTAFNSFVTGPTFTQSFTGSDSAAFFDFQSGGSPNYAFRVTAVNPSEQQVGVSLLTLPFSSISPSPIVPDNALVFTRQVGSAPISAFGGFFSIRDWDSGGARTTGTVTLTAFDGALQVAQHSFSVSTADGTFFGIAADDSNPITQVRLTGFSPDPTFYNVNAEQVTVGVVPVPEPSTLALGGCAILAIVCARRLKPRKARAVIGVSIVFLAMHVTSTMADSSFTPRPSDLAVVQAVEGRSIAPPMEPLGTAVFSRL